VAAGGNAGFSGHDRWGETSIMRDAAARGVAKNASRRP
jgi:hypothetical protein